MCIALDQLDEFAEACDFAVVRQIRKADFAEERQQMMLADRIERDVAHGHDALRLRREALAPDSVGVLTEAVE